jgi:maltose O-acetyltransferase
MRFLKACGRKDVPVFSEAENSGLRRRMTEIVNPTARFAKKYRGHLLHLAAEEYLGFFCRHIPGMEGILLRRVIYRRLFRRLGRHSLIYSGIYLTHTYGIDAGDYLSINTGALIDARGGITMGSGVMIGPNAVIVSSSHRFDRTDVAMTSLDHIMEPVIIGDDVWIGAQSFIRGGVTIGRGALVAAGAIVLDDVPDYKIIAGNPGRIVRDRRDI